MSSRYEQEKETMERYAKSKRGKIAHRKAKLTYRLSFHGAMKRRLWNKNLTPVEEAKAIKAFKNFKGKCDCCGSTKPNGKNWHLDHKDGKFRGNFMSSMQLCRRIFER
jgi:hypothetical protein